MELKQPAIDPNMVIIGAIAQNSNVAALPPHPGGAPAPANGAVAHCHTCLSCSAACVAAGCLYKGIHAQAQALANVNAVNAANAQVNNVPVNNAPVNHVAPPPEEKKDYQGKINQARASIASLNTTLGNMSASIVTLEKAGQDTGISMRHQLDLIEAIIDLIKLNAETSDATSKRMVDAMK